MQFADANGCTLIVANDPDADRLAVAEKLRDGSGWHLFTGNEIGSILGHWMISKWKAAGGAEDGSRPAAVLASVVSSRMLRRIAQVEGVQYFDTLTGESHQGIHLVTY